MERYRRRARLGEGTYAVVYDGLDTQTGRRVAIKKVKVGAMADGVNFAAVREIALLRQVRHANVVELLDVFYSSGNLNLVLEYLETDLEKVVQDRALVFQAGDIKAWMLMTLRGLHACHARWVLHRDVKPSNLLIAADGVVKLADFGLAKRFGASDVRMTPQVFTSFYRAPELLYGATRYSEGADMWAVGCVFAELMLRTPYLPGESDIHQLETIFRALGTPSEADWPGMEKLPNFLRFTPMPKPPMQQLFTGAGDDAIDLLEQLLRFDPLKRPTAEQALLHPYFSNLPRPTASARLPRPRAPVVDTKRARAADGAGDDGPGGLRRRLDFE